MKNLLFIALIFAGFIFAQAQERKTVTGKVYAKDSLDIERITVFNKNSLKGTTTDKEGTFEIDVRVNDTLIVRALQFEEFKLIVDRGIYETGLISISLNEAYYPLGEVVVRPYDLTGNVRVDVGKYKKDVNKNTEYLDKDITARNPMQDENFYKEGPREAYTYRTANAAMGEKQDALPGMNVLAVAGLIGKMFTSKEKQLKKQQVEADKSASTAVDDIGFYREIIDDEFLINELGIKEENIYEFLLFSREKGMRQVLQKDYDNPLRILEFLMSQAEAYKANKTE